MNKALLQELMKLTPAERVELAMDLWDSIPPEDLPPPTPEQIAEVERRLEEHQRDPSSAIPLEEVMTQLRARFRVK
jgi:putative addiction module component (TIGR02574 family)